MFVGLPSYKTVLILCLLVHCYQTDCEESERVLAMFVTKQTLGVVLPHKVTNHSRVCVCLNSAL